MTPRYFCRVVPLYFTQMQNIVPMVISWYIIIINIFMLIGYPTCRFFSGLKTVVLPICARKRKTILKIWCFLCKKQRCKYMYTVLVKWQGLQCFVKMSKTLLNIIQLLAKSIVHLSLKEVWNFSGMLYGRCEWLYFYNHLVRDMMKGKMDKS